MAAMKEFKHETLQECGAISEYLKVLNEGFETGQLVFRNEKEQIILRPDGMVQMEVKAKKKDRKIKLSLKFYWKEKEALGAKEDSLVINSKV
jgi:amphi-Trp domain-containing protein